MSRTTAPARLGHWEVVTPEGAHLETDPATHAAWTEAGAYQEVEAFRLIGQTARAVWVVAL